MKKLICGSLLFASCATATKPMQVAQQCPPSPQFPFTHSTDAASGDEIVTPKDMTENPVFRWNKASQAVLLIYPPDGVAQGLQGSLQMGKFKKAEEQKADEQKAPELKKK